MTIIEGLMEDREYLKSRLEDIELRLTVLQLAGEDSVVDYWSDYEDDVYRWVCVVPDCRSSSMCSGSLEDIPMKHEPFAFCETHRLANFGSKYP